MKILTVFVELAILLCLLEFSSLYCLMMRSIVQYFILKVEFEHDQMNLLGLASSTKKNLYEVFDKMDRTNRVKLTLAAY